MKKCPNCGGELYVHTNWKTGYFHCNACGRCMNAAGELYPAPVVEVQAPADEAAPVEPEPATEEAPKRTHRGAK